MGNEDIGTKDIGQKIGKQLKMNEKQLTAHPDDKHQLCHWKQTE
jgi:hypothetical protein